MKMKKLLPLLALTTMTLAACGGNRGNPLDDSKWPAEVKQALKDHMYSYNLPYFVTDALGELEFEWSDDDNALVVTGGEIETVEPLEAIKAMLVADGFTDLSDDLRDNEDDTLYYLTKEFDASGNLGKRDIAIQYGAGVETEDDFVYEVPGDFYAYIYCPYLYSWEEAGIDEMLEELDVTEKVPHLTEGRHYVIDVYTMMYYAYMGETCVAFYLDDLGEEAGETYAAVIEGTEGWEVAGEDGQYEALSPEETLYMMFGYNDEYETFDVTIVVNTPTSLPEEYAEIVPAVETALELEEGSLVYDEDYEECWTSVESNDFTVEELCQLLSTAAEGITGLEIVEGPKLIEDEKDGDYWWTSCQCDGWYLTILAHDDDGESVAEVSVGLGDAPIREPEADVDIHTDEEGNTVVSIDFAGLENQTPYAGQTAADLTIAASKGTNQNGPTYYNNNDIESLRFYPTNTLTFSVPEGKHLVSIEFDSAEGNKKTVPADENNLVVEGGKVAVEEGHVTITADENAQTISITFNPESGNIAIKEIVVKYK